MAGAWPWASHGGEKLFSPTALSACITSPVRIRMGSGISQSQNDIPLYQKYPHGAAKP